MKRKYISLILALVLIFVNAPIKISAAQVLGTTFEYDATNKTGSMGASTNFAADTQFLVVEYSYTPDATNKTAGAGPYNGTNYWMPIRFGSDGTIKANYYSNSASSATNIGNYVAGETYHVLGIIKLGSNVSGAARIYLNGVSLGSYSIWTNTTAWYQKSYISPGIKVQITPVSGIETAADFDASAYSALVSSKDADIEITGEGYSTKWFRNFAIDASKKRDITASELLSNLEIPQDATARILYEGEEIGENDILETDMELVVTSANGKVVHSYAITAGLTLIKSSIYKINKQEQKISGIKRYTPTEDFLSAFTIKEATSIEGVSPQGDFIENGMQLEVLDAEGNSVYFDLVLSEKYTELVPDEELYLIKNLDGEMAGKKTLIEVSVDIPEEGLTEDISLYFRMYDATKAYAMQISKEGELSFWKNAAGTVQNGKTYDFSVVTDSLSGTFDAYVNGVRVLSGASLNGEMDATTDPYELIANYDAEGLLLTEVYSLEGYGDYYEESSALIDSNNENIGVSIKGAEDLSVNMFVSQDYTVGELKSDLILPEDATLNFYDETDGEITDDTALVSQASYLSVTSKNSKYTANYLLSIATEVLRSDSFNVDNNEKTVSGILSYTPVSVILAALEVRPDYTLSGIFRGEEKLTSGVISNGDKIRLIKNDAVMEYDIVITPDIAPEGTVYTIPDGTLGSVTILECEVTLPLEGEIPTMNYYLYNPETAKEAWFFGVGATGYLSIWGARRIENMERGRTYTVAVLNNHKAAKADIYIDGIKVASGVSTTTWMLTTTEFTQMRLSGSSKTVTNTRFYKAYDAESFKYINDITLKSTGNGVTANPNLITVNDAACINVSDLLSTLTFPSKRAEETVKVFGNGAEITDTSIELRNDMYLTFEAEGGITGKYLIDIPSKPITSYVFTVGEDDISYNANLTYYDFIRHSILSRGTQLKVLRADGSEVTDGNLDSTMKAKAGEKTYTITLSGTSPLPKVNITDAVEDEIIQTTDTFTKTVKLEGTDITKATVYFDGAAIPLTASAGEYTFAKTNLTVGRHEFYAEVYSENGKSMTKTYAVYVFDKDVDRLPVADQPVVMDIYYLDADGNTLTAGESVSSEKLKAIKLFFNKELLESSITKENIVLSKDGNVVTGYGVSYTQNDTDYIVTMSLDENLDYSSQYQITVMAPLTAADENTAQADSVITFKTSPKPFDIINKILLDENGDEATSLAGGDSAKVSLSLTNTSVENKDGIAVLVIYEGSRMVGYSLTGFNIPAGTVNQTIPTNTAQIASAATGTLTYKVYLWEGVNDRTSMLN